MTQIEFRATVNVRGRDGVYIAFGYRSGQDDPVAHTTPNVGGGVDSISTREFNRFYQNNPEAKGVVRNALRRARRQRVNRRKAVEKKIARGTLPQRGGG